LHDKIQYICANFSDKVHFTRGKVGTVSEGEAEMNLSIGELLRKQAKF
jgi:phosphate transport system substrate-binding protein